MIHPAPHALTVHVDLACAIGAAAAYGLPANVLLAVAETEGGRPGQWVANRNGTYDVGPLQFNTAYLRRLAPYGIRPQDVAAPGCFPYRLAAWRIRGHVNSGAGDYWTRVANYHSYTPAENRIYRGAVITRAYRWMVFLQGRYGVPVSSQAVLPSSGVGGRRPTASAGQ